MQTPKWLFWALILIAVSAAGCGTAEPGRARTTTLSRHPLKPEQLRSRPAKVAIVDRLPPVLYINDAEGSFWAGKSLFVPAAEVAGVNQMVDARIGEAVVDLFGPVTVVRLSPEDVRRDSTIDWIIELNPNGRVVPDFSWGAFAKIVLVASARVAAGTPAPMAVVGSAGDPAAAGGTANRPAYRMGTHAIYGTYVFVEIAWTIREGRTGRELATLEAATNIHLSAGKIKKPWADWTAEERSMMWADLQRQVPTIIPEHLERLGLLRASP